MKTKDIKTLRYIKDSFDKEREKIKAQQAEAEKLLKQIAVEIEEIKAEVVALQEEQWMHLKQLLPVDDVLRRQLN